MPDPKNEKKVYKPRFQMSEARATKRSEHAIRTNLPRVWSLCGRSWPTRLYLGKTQEPRAPPRRNAKMARRGRGASPLRYPVSSSPAVTLRYTFWGTARGAGPEAPWGVSKGGFTRDLVDVDSSVLVRRGVYYLISNSAEKHLTPKSKVRTSVATTPPWYISFSQIPSSPL